MENKEVNLIDIAIVQQLYQAMLMQSVLDQAEIPCFIQNENMSQLYGNACGGVWVQVPENYLSKAREVLIEAGYGAYLFSVDD